MTDTTFRRQSISPALPGYEKPAGARSSVFDVGAAESRADAATAAVAKRRSPSVVQPPPADLEIKRGVPIPAAPRGVHADAYGGLLKRMEAGDMVEISERQSKSMAHRARALGIKVTVRRLSGGQFGVWRIE